jgi:hypothetical protein
MKLPIITLTAALALGIPFANSAEPRKKPAPEAAPDGEKKEPRSLNGRPLPYRVKVTALDEQAATFSSAGKGGAINVFAVTEKTTITRNAKPATFADLAVGSIVSGVRTRTLGGKWEVASVNILGTDAAPKTRSAKKEAAAKPTEKKADEAKPAEKPGVAPAPAEAPKVAEPGKPEEPKPDAKPEEKKAE